MGDREISKKFLAARVYAVICHFMPKIVFLPLLVAILNFCQTKKYVVSSTERDVLGIHRVNCHFLANIVFMPFLAAIKTQKCIFLGNGTR